MFDDVPSDDPRDYRVVDFRVPGEDDLFIATLFPAGKVLRSRHSRETNASADKRVIVEYDPKYHAVFDDPAKRAHRTINVSVNVDTDPAVDNLRRVVDITQEAIAALEKIG